MACHMDSGTSFKCLVSVLLGKLFIHEKIANQFSTIVSPYLLLVTFILLGISAYYASFYLDGARDTKRLESVAKSPVFEHLSAALPGVTSLRAYEKMETYTASMFAKIDAHGRCLWHLNIYKRWLGWRLAVIGTAFSTIVAVFLVGYKSMDAALAGFALSFALSYSDAVFYMLRQYVELELGMNSTERIIEYSEIEIESQSGVDVPASWPSQGALEVDNLVVGYAPGLPAVLKGLNFEVKPKERIGVVGRTGAGKSSLTLALFRFLEAREGKIYIDGIDVSTIKLHDLRSRLAIIPQDPVLFSGTVRSNLDPFDERSDSELFEALHRVHLIEDEEDSDTPSSSNQAKPANINLFSDLSSQVSESGSNLSQGQRQLLCLARAIVSRPKIMFLDEATSAVDKITDSLIQRSIREEFEDATLLVIAHRLSTIADFDRILVLDDGKVVEYDTPRKLWDLGPEKGIFRAMVESSGERDVLRDIVLGTSSSERTG
jgi:ABC-type multidrug transport system fused ATPase/permease subunit